MIEKQTYLNAKQIVDKYEAEQLRLSRVSGSSYRQQFDWIAIHYPECYKNIPNPVNESDLVKDLKEEQGKFAEWCSFNNYEWYSVFKKWKNNGKYYTTQELMKEHERFVNENKANSINKIL